MNHQSTRTLFLVLGLAALAGCSDTGDYPSSSSVHGSVNFYGSYGYNDPYFYSPWYGGGGGNVIINNPPNLGSGGNRPSTLPASRPSTRPAGGGGRRR
jgi:hypothetical protein